MLKQALLGLLHYQEMSGYDLEQFINTSITHFWNAKLSQIYRTLKQMENEGLVTSTMEEQDGVRSKRLYRLTDAGKTEFESWVDEYDTDEQEVKLPFLMRLFFYGRKNPADVSAQLRVWRDMHHNQLTYYEEFMANHFKEHLDSMEMSGQDIFFQKATLQFGIMYEQMVIEWMNKVMNEWESHSDSIK